MIAIELVAATDAAGTTQTFYVSDAHMVTSASDTPANTAFRDTLLDPGSIGITAFADGRTGGSTKLQLGETVLANLDGRYDAWTGYGFDGRSITIRSGVAGAAYPAGWTTLFSGTMEGVDVGIDKVVVRLRDKQFIFTVPVLSTTYAGTNAPSGFEGTANDLKGKVKPRTYGKVLNVAPPCIDTTKLIYQVSDGAVAAIVAYAKGVVVPADTTPDYGTRALLAAATITAGKFATCLAEGLFRLASDPTGQVTADVTQGATAADRTAAQILKALALAAGVASGSISSADVTAVDAANSAVVGVWIGDQSTYQSIMDQVAASVGAAYGFDGAGLFRMWRLDSPSGTAALALTTGILGDDLQRRPVANNVVPVWAVTVQHTKLYTVQSSDLAGAAASQRSYLANEFRTERATDATIKTQFLLAGDVLVETRLTAAADAATEAARLLARDKVTRDIFEDWIEIKRIPSTLRLGSIVTLTHSRFGLSGGRSFVLIGMTAQLAKARVLLTLWG